MANSSLLAVVRAIPFAALLFFVPSAGAADDPQSLHVERGWVPILKDDPDRFEYINSLSGYHDHMSGLVWFAIPTFSDINAFPADSWSEAVQSCETLQVGQVMGWRLPSIHELAALFESAGERDADDFSNVGGVLAGNPVGLGCDFIDNSPFGAFMQDGQYLFWSITESYRRPGDFRIANPGGSPRPLPLRVPGRYVLVRDIVSGRSPCIQSTVVDSPNPVAWCVRGGSGTVPRPPWSLSQ